MDVRLPAQLGRPLKVALPVGRVAPIGQAAAVDAFLTARLLERPIRRLLPRLAGLVQPIPGLGRPALARPATLRGLGVVPLEPLRGGPRDPVITTLGEHQVRVGIRAGRAAAVEGERIGQPLPGTHPLGERAGELTPAARVQLARQGELDLAVEPPVGALMIVRRLPVGARGILRPVGHVAVRHMLQLVGGRSIAPLALDVRALGAGGLPTGAGPEAGFEVIDRHAVTSCAVWTHAVSRRETEIVRLSAADRKRRTRRLIFIGSYIEHTTQADPAEHDRLMQGLAGFLERDQDRALFDLPTTTETAAAAGEPLPRWRPHRLPTGDWGAIYHGNTATLPAELVGTPITVQAKKRAALDRHRHGGCRFNRSMQQSPRVYPPASGS